MIRKTLMTIIIIFIFCICGFIGYNLFTLFNVDGLASAVTSIPKNNNIKSIENNTNKNTIESTNDKSNQVGDADLNSVSLELEAKGFKVVYPTQNQINILQGQPTITNETIQSVTKDLSKGFEGTLLSPAIYENPIYRYEGEMDGKDILVVNLLDPTHIQNNKDNAYLLILEKTSKGYTIVPNKELLNAYNNNSLDLKDTEYPYSDMIDQYLGSMLNGNHNIFGSLINNKY